RKSVGGGAPQLMGQYLLDAFLHTLVASIFAIAFLALAFPKLAPMLELPAELDLVTPRNLGLCLALVVLFTLLSSFYPAWLTAQAKPAPLLRNGAGAVVGTGTQLRKLLVGIQFAIVVVLLLASGVVHQQIEYTRTRDPGYSLDNVIASRVGIIQGVDTMRTLITELNRLPGVDVAAAGSVSPGTIMISSGNPVTYTDAEGRVREGAIQGAGIGPNYMRAMSVRILAGREFTAEDEPPTYDPNAPPTTGKVVLNEAAARALGFATPDAALDQLIESQVSMGTQGTRKNTMRVIGVVADTQFSSAMLPPVAQYYTFSLQNGFLAVKLQPGADRVTVTEAVETIWEDVISRPFQAADEALMTGFQLRREELEARRGNRRQAREGNRRAQGNGRRAHQYRHAVSAAVLEADRRCEPRRMAVRVLGAQTVADTLSVSARYVRDRDVGTCGKCCGTAHRMVDRRRDGRAGGECESGEGAALRVGAHYVSEFYARHLPQLMA
ncbi:MAG: ABC transporter permease, partial [Gammaproteobacteria bacterium]